MILFERDYYDLSPDHFDVNTRNTSFVRVYQILRKMGIKNNKFFLVILDKDLIGYNPHNLKDNSMELRLRIARECKLNPWYCFREVIRIPESGSDGVMFELNRANLSMIWLFFNHIDNLLIMPRQIGKTMGALSIGALVMYVTGFNLVFSLLTKDAKLRKENIARLKDIRDGMPDYLVGKSRSDADNSEELSYTALRNKYNSYVAQSSISGADRLGRGMTTPCQHWDEPAFFANIRTTYPTAISSTTRARENAKKNGQPYGNILTTTAGKLNTDEGEFVHELICNSLVFTEQLYDLKSEEELHSIVRMNSRQGMIYSEFSYRQLGRTDEWFRDVTSRTVGDEDSIARDYLNRWTFGTAKGPVDRKILDRLYEGRKEPKFVQYIDEFMIRWYIPESTVKTPALFASIPIVIGMDASENVGRDFTSFIFVDARNFSVIASCSCNTINIIKVALFICKWLIHKNVIFIPERNSVGVAIIDYCLLQLEKMGINPFYRIYNTIIHEFREHQANDPRKINRSTLAKPGIWNDYRKEFGFRTGADTRTLLYKTVFFKALEIGVQHVNDQSLIAQIAGLTIKNGRIDHGNGKNDDEVIAYILTAFLLFFGNNLEMYDFCGGNTENLLKDIPSDKDGDSANTIDLEEVETIKTQIGVLERQVKFENNPTLRVEALHKLDRYKKALPKEDDRVIANISTVSQLKGKKLALPGTDDRSKSDHIISFLSGIA